MLLCSVLWGYLSIRCINYILGKKKVNEYITLDFVMIFGIGVLTIFAEYFSLFSGVDFFANIILLVVDIFVMICWRKDIILMVRQQYSNKRTCIIKIGIILIFSLVSMSSMFKPLAYDTDLYHMQSILWIQKYGVVAGLGNLHHRFAYNSALMCLQALFSMKFLIGQQLHCVNGFIFAFFLCYVFFSFKGIKYKRIFVSDFARLAFLVYFNFDNSYSSCGSDFASLCIVVYIVIKYIEGIESDINDILTRIVVLYLLYEIRVCVENSYASENIMRQNSTSESLKKIDEIEENETKVVRKEKTQKEFKKVIDCYIKKVIRGGTL